MHTEFDLEQCMYIWRAGHAKAEGVLGATWREIAQYVGAFEMDFTNPPEAVRSWFRRNKDKDPEELFGQPVSEDTLEVPVPMAEPVGRIVGIGPGEFKQPTFDEAYTKATQEFEKVAAHVRARENQQIVFDHAPVGITFIGDTHLGAKDADVERLFSVLKQINETPGLYAIFLGDLCDDFIYPSLLNQRLNATITQREAWVLTEHAVGLVAEKTLATVGGNHEGWIPMLTGVDYFRSVMADVVPGALYGKEEIEFDLIVGMRTWSVRMRHRWTGHGSSQYHPYHPLVKAALWDDDADVYVGGHDHRGAGHESLGVRGRQVHFVKVGCWRIDDQFMRRRAFLRPGPHDEQTLIFTESGIVAPDTMDGAIDYLDATYKGG